MEKRKFKQTEMGEIPEDWEVCDLNKLSSKIGDGIHSTPQYQQNGEYFFINGNNLSNGKVVITKETKTVSRRKYPLYKRDLNHKSILLSINGTIGNLAFYDSQKIILGKSAAYINLNEKADRAYIYYALQTDSVIQYFKNELTGSTIKNLGINSIRNTKMLLPRIEEQTAIATVLSDTDELIAKLEQLIAKKKAIKQGAMQELLTGKKRLPGFSGEWEERKFKDKEVTKLITCGIAATPKYVEENIGVPFLSSTNVKEGEIHWDNFKYIERKLHDQLYKNNPPLRGDLLYSRVGTIGEAAIINVDFEFSIYVSLTLIKPGILIHNEFLKQLLNSNKYKSLASNTVLMGGGVGNLNVNVVREFPIIFPSIEEQTVIATTLTEMDQEIETLEKQRDKYLAIKQGMMQQLLTGKIRLI